MKWAGLLLLLLFALSLQPLFSESPSVEEMTEAEILSELIENLNNREMALNEREANSKIKENNLDLRESFLNLTENYLNGRETDLDEREKSWTEINNYWKSYGEEMRKKAQTEFWKGFAVGSAAGGIGGFSLGFKIKY